MWPAGDDGGGARYGDRMGQRVRWKRVALAAVIFAVAVLVCTGAGVLVAGMVDGPSSVVSALVASSLAVAWFGIGSVLQRNRRQRRIRAQLDAMPDNRVPTRLHGGPADRLLVPIHPAQRRFRVATREGGHIYLRDDTRRAELPQDADADAHLFYAPSMPRTRRTARHEGTDD